MSNAAQSFFHAFNALSGHVSLEYCAARNCRGSSHPELLSRFNSLSALQKSSAFTAIIGPVRLDFASQVSNVQQVVKDKKGLSQR